MRKISWDNVTKGKALVKGLMLLASLGVASESGATSRLPRTLAELTAESEAVIYGEVLAQTFSRDASGMLWTHYDFRVVNVLAGEFAGSVLQFNCIGGAIGGEAVVAVGTPSFSPGERALIFYDDDNAH